MRYDLLVHEPIAYCAEIRPEDTERAQKTVTASLFPNEQAPYAIDFSGKCPRCGDNFESRHWLFAVSSGLRSTTLELETFARNFLAKNTLTDTGDITVELDCACNVDHPNRPEDVSGCGARFRIRATWP
jgi:hypothetical protein